MFNRWLEISPHKSLLLLGARRAGKTTLLTALFPNERYLTLDDFDLLSLAKQDPKKLLDTPAKITILDEVQRHPELLITVKYFMDNHQKIFLMTGSSSIGLLSHGSETLAGRVQLQFCPTVCWGENEGPSTHPLFTMPQNPLQIKEANRKLDVALKFGGFPEVLMVASEKDKERVLKNYRDTYFTKDLALLSNIENIDALLAILKYLGIKIGSSGDISHFSREVGVSMPTIKKYLNILEQSHLSFKLYSYAHGPAKKFIKAPKRYFSDNGIITALQIQLSSGQILENFVISEIEKRRHLGSLDCPHLQYFKSTSGFEIDLIIEEPDLTTAIEIKATRNPATADVRHLHKFVTDAPKKRRGILLYLGEEKKQFNGIDVLPIAHLWRAK